MSKRLTILASLIFITSCNIPIPPPEPPGNPCDGIVCDKDFHCENGKCVADPLPPPVCLPELPWCNELNPPAVCGECKHNPTNDPSYCEKAPPCAPVDPCDGVVCQTGYHCKAGNCIKDPVIPPDPPNTGNCPKTLAPGSVVYMNENNYGMGFDATVRVRGDSEFCFAIHGVNTNDCHLDGWSKRTECEMELIAGCPIWQFSVDGSNPQVCHDDQNALASCDHFGNTVFRDDPKTPDVFEGMPKVCGLQKDSFGPYAGFFTIAHGNALIRACKPDGVASTCGPWKPFNH